MEEKSPLKLSGRKKKKGQKGMTPVTDFAGKRKKKVGNLGGGEGERNTGKKVEMAKFIDRDDQKQGIQKCQPEEEGSSVTNIEGAYLW